jgi:hypothetical protein
MTGLGAAPGLDAMRQYCVIAFEKAVKNTGSSFVRTGKAIVSDEQPLPHPEQSFQA